ncbi:maltose alpha-D-glucosyltransferase/ alpha-amylase [Halomicrobium zhouii]|uniref:Maltose alpha-D-glucosyltransferase/ alpha-amylase n=1 Tax=Halomicrobium zhouii TaxID=767519 RepID=A0A1I6M1P8_9EURY|nr:alpha-amylase family glycosyl hydrolase [Halomicrobium zhouii]SFS09611.1 maltose alpha-D-glucosyltransferase/ alpha-amylase [Halomicrobium zhouii]
MTTSDFWYKNALIYGVDLETFMDSDGDGVGDIQGLIGRLDYLDRLGVDCLWVLPFYPSPRRDDGYDVTDYYDVDDRYGTLGDFVELVREADSRGIRVLIDLIVNHTSRDHPWFQKARRGEQPYRDYYVWSEDPPEPEVPPIFPDEEDSVWSYDEEAAASYYHRFYSHEPGLDMSNPAVRREVEQIMGFWLQLGVSGFRFDAAPIMIGKKGLESTAMANPHDVFREFREFVDRRSEDALLLGEAGGTASEVGEFFGDGDELNMLFDFLLAGYLFHSLATEDAASLSEGLKILPEMPETGQWANFLRNHDELNLEWVTEAQRQDVFDAFAPDESMRIFDRGVRRRLAPMFDGDQARIRMAVRTPMQWADEENAGFSSAPASELTRPVVDDEEFGYESVNVDDQRFDEGSLLNWMESLSHTRMEHPEIGWGDCAILDVETHDVFAHRADWDGRSLVAVHNLTGDPQTTAVTLEEGEDACVVPVFGDQDHGVDGGTIELDMDPYGYHWFRVGIVQNSPVQPIEDRSP